ncbi:hypothetical protein JTB14_015617 [Gonioctena quinquepunctata]|nr:hypothetical protein JTB14_015617 [Gonioctena quinquepunctata]
MKLEDEGDSEMDRTLCILALFGSEIVSLEGSRDGCQAFRPYFKGNPQCPENTTSVCRYEQLRSQDFPMPAIRWKESTPDVVALREKEKGDWKNLSVEEKKALYRASFCQTFAEFKAPTGEWKSVLGIGLTLMSGALWIFYFLKTFVYSPLPITFSPEYREAQLRRIIDLQANPIQGISSKWDYEKDDWKK